ncbi:MAG: endolytic transglycosylase MltG [Balneolales bacterium]
MLRFNYLYLKEWGIVFIVLMFAFLLVFSSRYWRLHQKPAIHIPEETVIYFDSSVGMDELVDQLIVNGIEFDREELVWAAGVLKWQRFHRGRYEFAGSKTYPEFLSKLALGLQDPLPLLVPAGVTKEMLKVRIADQMHFEAEDLASAMQDSSFLNRHGLEEHLVYGRILPDTYEVYWTTTPEQLLDRLMSEFNERVTRAYDDRLEELGRSVDEITTLASIIEWEARYDIEKPLISGLYWNRLNQRWRLQADPTVNYAKGERNRLIYADYNIDHPYNTYRIYGLPPGPITNPSFSSLQAALFPEEHNYMYMVATPDGVHDFSRTYAEHLRKSREWTNWLREQRRIRFEMEQEEETTEGAHTHGF